jgi:hypothetical protein
MPPETRRTEFAAVVQPGVGLGPIRFGVFAADVRATLGAPAEDLIDEDGDRLLAYPEFGVSFFSFDHEENMRLTTCELAPDSDAELWGLPLFRTPREVIEQVAVSRNLSFTWSGDASDGEMLFQIRSQALDFYFEGESLTALTVGVVFSDDDTIQWPAAP